MEGAIDLIVNMSGHDVPASASAQVEKWDVRDPIGESEEVYRQVRDEIEQRVLELDRKAALAQAGCFGSATHGFAG